MAKTTPFFWTDLEQAQQRIQNTLVLYDDTPAYVSEIRPGDDGCPRATICLVPDAEKTFVKRLDSPKFKRFRELPKLGWINYGEGKTYFLKRAARNTRTHGLNSGNVHVVSFDSHTCFPASSQRIDFENLMFDKGILDAHKGNYPSLEGILRHIKESSSIAYSNNYAVYRDSLGLRWLFRREERIGVFTGMDTLNLLGKFAFYREEIMEDPLFTLNNIQEF